METQLKLQRLYQQAHEPATDAPAGAGEEHRTYELYRAWLETIAGDAHRSFEEIFCEAVDRWVTDQEGVIERQVRLPIEDDPALD